MDRKVTKEKNKIVFKPGANYEWEPDDTFQLSGLEIDRINKALAAASSSPDFQRHAVIYEGLIAFNNFFRSAVEDGSIKEKPLEEADKKLSEMKVVKEEPPMYVGQEKANVEQKESEIVSET